MLLGAHMSIEGGLDQAVERAKRAGCDVLQLFTKSSNQWNAKSLTGEDVARFKARLTAEGIGHVSAHDSYLINLATPDDVLHRRSIDAFIIELARCRDLGIPNLIAHPGAHTGSGLDAGVARIAAALDEAIAAVPEPSTTILLETWAGQGTTIGSRFEELARIIAAVAEPSRIGICFDTCHVFAAGYDIRTEAGYAATFEEFDRQIGLDRIRAFHLNDSKNDLGCRVDRHEQIGRGWIGLEAFRLLMNDARFAGVPMYLETPKGPELLEDIENLGILRSLIGDREVKFWTAPPPKVAKAAKAVKSAGAGKAPGIEPVPKEASAKRGKPARPVSRGR